MLTLKKFTAIAVVCLTALPAIPCSTVGVMSPGRKLMGYNYEWHISLGNVYVNKRNVHKRAMVLRPNDAPAEWVSRYGSVTFNQYGREFPNGGINEAGLAIEIMWLTESVYPAADERPTVNELQWIQFMLDNHATVDEMAKAAHQIRISLVTAPVHYMACDARGECGSFEYLNGEMTVHHSNSMPVTTLTNDNYARSLDFLREHIGFGGDKPIPQDEESLSRFVRGTALAKLLRESDYNPFDVFEIMDAVAQPNTVWQAVYNLPSRHAFFRTSDNRAAKIIDLNGLDFACSAPVRMIDMQLSEGGPINDRLVDYTDAANAALVEEAIMTVPIEIPAELRRLLVGAISAYPSSTRCME